MQRNAIGLIICLFADFCKLIVKNVMIALLFVVYIFILSE